MPRGETHYFRDPYYRLQTLADVGSLFDGQAGVKRRGIKCPDYLGSAESPARLRRDLDEPDLIVTLRDPVQRAVSAYYWWMLWSGLPVEPAHLGLPKLLAGDYAQRYPDSYRILDYGLYAKHLRRYLQHFSREKLLVLLDEDLRIDSGGTLDRACRFLGLHEGFRTPALASVQNAGVYSLRRLRWLNRRNRYVVSRDPQTGGLMLQRPTRPLPFVQNAAVMLVDRLLLSKMDRNHRPSLPPELRARLYDYYRDDIAELEDLLGRELPSWRNR